MLVFEWRSEMPVSADEVWEYHARPGAFRRLVPPWQKLSLLEEVGTVAGGRLVFDIRSGPLKRRWVAETSSAVPGRQFVDRQVDGPFSSWEHVHRFVPIDRRRSDMIDHVECSLPAGVITDMAGAGSVGRTLSRLFRFRHRRTQLDLERHARWSDRAPLRVAIAGASGLIGSHLCDYLTTAGHDVVRLVRRRDAGPGEIPWDPSAGVLHAGALEGVDAIVNLAGISLAGLWTASRKKAILESRVNATRTLTQAIERMDSPPSVLVSASAVGAYGSRGDETITERVPLGTGFLAEVCRSWEEAAAPAARTSGVRLVTPRLGIVVSGAGGAFASMLPAFRLGLGARLGQGDQYWSWVALDDVLAAIEWALHDEGIEGAVNVTSPNPLPNRDVTRTLGRVVHRPARLAVPAQILRQALSGMGEEMLLASQRAVPTALEARGFRFTFPTLASALRYELGRS